MIRINYVVLQVILWPINFAVRLITQQLVITAR